MCFANVSTVSAGLLRFSSHLCHSFNRLFRGCCGWVVLFSPSFIYYWNVVVLFWLLHWCSLCLHLLMSCLCCWFVVNDQRSYLLSLVFLSACKCLFRSYSDMVVSTFDFLLPLLPPEYRPNSDNLPLARRCRLLPRGVSFDGPDIRLFQWFNSEGWIIVSFPLSFWVCLGS